ncbi:hypothetical protein Tco_0939891 [Tanacetum coccineum]|uniref:Uncharacterized protein n=1 Tax=Tanacetum coccineum TaxID=301880 RepID=A0ABQ5DLE0_9ASTR
MRINPGMKPKEPTYQVVLDALALTTCYPAFLITAEVLVIYMHQFGTVNKHKASYRFKINNKRFSMNVEMSLGGVVGRDDVLVWDTYRAFEGIEECIVVGLLDCQTTCKGGIGLFTWQISLWFSSHNKLIVATEKLFEDSHSSIREEDLISRSKVGAFEPKRGRFIYPGLTLLEMAIRNFVYAENEEDLSFFPKEPSPDFGTRSPSVSVNIEPLMTNEETHVLVAARMNNRKCKTRVQGHPGLCECLFSKQYLAKIEGLSDVPKLKDATACHLKISNITPPAWKNHLDNYMDLELLDLHDCCYARKLLDRAQEEESEGLRAKCEYAMSDFEKNPNVVALREKISTLSSEVKEHKANLDRMMLESQKWAGYQFNLSHFGVTGCVTGSDKAGVVPYAAMELIHSDDLGSLVGKLVILLSLGECKALELGAAMKDPFASQRWKGYHSSYKK